jgi:hypothetical protein
MMDDLYKLVRIMYKSEIGEDAGGTIQYGCAQLLCGRLRLNVKLIHCQWRDSFVFWFKT